LVAGAALVFLSVMKELPATLLLRPNGFETLAIRIWSSTAEGFITRASAAGLVLLAVSIVPLFLVMSRELSD
jgi:iron(III) transport system permease protein